jgi:hypothetical protein
MGINVNLGVTGYVAVEDTQGRSLYCQPVSSEKDAHQWIETYKTSAPRWNILEASLIVVRTDHLADLAKDFFLPTFVNHALKVNNLFLRVIASIFAISWDAITLASRLITLPIRMCCKAPKKLPVLQLIETSPHFKSAMRQGTVNLLTHVENSQPVNGLGITRVERKSYAASFEVSLKDLPGQEGDCLLNTAIVHFDKISDETWTIKDAGRYISNGTKEEVLQKFSQFISES